MKPIYIAPRRTAGLNNLKMVIFGMMELAKRDNGGYFLPQQFFDFTPTEEGIGDQYLPAEDVFDLDALNRFFSASSDQDGELKRLGNAEYLDAAKAAIAADAGESGISRNQTAQAFASFLPAKPLQNAVDQIFFQLPRDTCALQLRIERDWQEYAVRKGWVDGGSAAGCEVVLNHRRIFDKIAATPHIPKNIFVCCDEEDLPVSKEEIINDAQTRGLNLIFKSTFKTPFQSRLQKSVIDFGVCLKLETYIGTPRSTFSNILCMAKATSSAGHPDHYVFDAKANVVRRRSDCGRAGTAAHAIIFDYIL